MMMQLTENDMFVRKFADQTSMLNLRNMIENATEDDDTVKIGVKILKNLSARPHVMKYL